MKKYWKFVKKLNEEDLQQVKQDIADKVASEEAKKGQGQKDLDKMSIDEKPNDKIIDDVKNEIENFEKQKLAIQNSIDAINNQIELFNKQSDPNITQDPNIRMDMANKTKNLIKKIEDLQKQIQKYDELIKDASDRQEKWKENNK